MGLRSFCEAVLTDAMYEMPGTDEKDCPGHKGIRRRKIEQINS